MRLRQVLAIYQQEALRMLQRSNLADLGGLPQGVDWVHHPKHAWRLPNMPAPMASEGRECSTCLPHLHKGLALDWLNKQGDYLYQFQQLELTSVCSFGILYKPMTTKDYQGSSSPTGQARHSLHT